MAYAKEFIVNKKQELMNLLARFAGESAEAQTPLDQKADQIISMLGDTYVTTTQALEAYHDAVYLEHISK